jgi:hypothetical protein
MRAMYDKQAHHRQFYTNIDLLAFPLTELFAFCYTTHPQSSTGKPIQLFDSFEQAQTFFAMVCKWSLIFFYSTCQA